MVRASLRAGIRMLIAGAWLLPKRWSGSVRSWRLRWAPTSSDASSASDRCAKKAAALYAIRTVTIHVPHSIARASDHTREPSGDLLAPLELLQHFARDVRREHVLAAALDLLER